MNQKQYRQGDVMLTRIDALPAKLKKQPASNARVILALGEVSNHHHSFAANQATKLVGEDGSEYFRLTGQKLTCKLKIVRRWRSQVMVNHPEFGNIEFAESDVKIVRGYVHLDGDFALLTHQEHTIHGIPAGLYQGAGAGKRVRQTEYSPEMIRNVAD